MSGDGWLHGSLIYLGAAVVAVPLSRLLGLGSIIGYLAAGIAIGGRYLTTVSLEYERDVIPAWSGAAFVDAGDVWSQGKPELAFAAGVGARWQSPVGPIRVDIARGFDGPERGWQLHISAGPDL